MSKTKIVNVSEIFDSVADSNFDTSVLEHRVIMPKPKNILDWVSGQQFLNLPMPLYARQAEAVIKATCDYCPNCTDLKYLDNPDVADDMQTFTSRVCILEDGICPSCGRNRQDTFQMWWDQEGKAQYEDAKPIFYPPTAFAGCWGQRSGKSLVCGTVLMTYRMMQHMVIPDPYKYYSILPGAIFMCFLAQNKEKAKTQLWPYFYGPVSGSAPWFREYAKQARKVEKDAGLEKESLYKIRQSFVQAGGLTVTNEVMDGNVLRGATRIGITMDEIAFLPRGDELVGSVDTAYTSLLNSLATIGSAADKLWRNGDYNVPFPLMLNISSPAHQYDKIMELLSQAEKSPRVIGSHHATWEMNPNLPEESFSEYADKAELKRNFGAIPPIANSPYISNYEAIECAQSDHTELLKIVTVPADVGGIPHVGAAIAHVQPNLNMKCILALDGGHTNNAFAITMMHLEYEGNEILLKIDETFSAIPESYKDGRKVKVSFVSMADLVMDICENFNVVGVGYDRWNSIGEIQRLRNNGINAVQYSPKFSDFEAFKQLVNVGNLRTPKCEKDPKNLNLDSVLDLRQHPYTHLAYQLATVQGIGKKVTKPVKGDDDMFRTLVLGYAMVREKPAEFITSAQGAGFRTQNQGGGLRAVSLTNSGQRRSMGGGGNPSKSSIAVGKGRSRR